MEDLKNSSFFENNREVFLLATLIEIFDGKLLLKISTLSEKIETSSSTIRTWIYSGELKAINSNGTIILVSILDFYKFLLKRDCLNSLVDRTKSEDAVDRYLLDDSEKIFCKAYPRDNQNLDGYYDIRFRLNGKYIERSIGKCSIVKAKRIEDYIRQLLIKGDDVLEFIKRVQKNPPDEIFTLRMIADKYLEFLQKSGMNKKKVICDKRRLYNDFPKFLLEMKIDKVKKADVEYALKLRSNRKDGKGKIGPATYNRLLHYTKALFTWAVQQEYIDKSPAKNISKLDEESVRKGYARLTQSQRDVMYRCLQDKNDLYRAVYLADYFGLRLNEVGSLKWKNIDVENEFVHIEDEKSKTKKGRRIPFPARKVKNEIKSWKRDSKELFGNTAGTISKNFNKYVRDLLGWKQKESFEALRTTYASDLYEADVPEHSYKLLMGHSINDVTGKHYIHTSDETLKRHARLLRNVRDDIME